MDRHSSHIKACVDLKLEPGHSSRCESDSRELVPGRRGCGAQQRKIGWRHCQPVRCTALQNDPQKCWKMLEKQKTKSVASTSPYLSISHHMILSMYCFNLLVFLVKTSNCCVPCKDIPHFQVRAGHVNHGACPPSQRYVAPGRRGISCFVAIKIIPFRGVMMIIHESFT